ncbi:MAG: efflux RND transporter periplasmic adaptor subunit, partial [Acidobacteriota bacterium]
KNEFSFKIENKDLDLELENAKVEQHKADNKLLQAREFQAGKEVQKARFEAEFARFKLEALHKKFDSRKSAQQLQLQTLRDKEAFFRKRVESNRQAVEALTVVAPISGVLVYQTNWNNEKKKVGDQVYMSENIFGIPNLDTLGVKARIAEVDTGRLALGQKVNVTLDALPDEVFRGSITEIGTIFKQASFNQPSRILDVAVELDRIDSKRMRPGMAARLQIVVDRFEQVIAVPISALQLEGDGAYVWVRDSEGSIKRKVEVGQGNGIVAIIESGLEEGEEIASRPVLEEEG